MGKDLNSMGATEGQVLQWTNSETGWMPVTLHGDGTSASPTDIASANKATNTLKLLAGITANKYLKLDEDANLAFPENKFIFKEKSSIHFKSDSGNREFSLSNPAGLFIFRDETDDRSIFQINESGDVTFHGNLNIDNSKLLTVMGKNVCLSDGTNCKLQTVTTPSSTPTNYVVATNSIDAGKILDGSIATAEMANNAITTEKIQDASVTLTKMGAISIGGLLVGSGTGVTTITGTPGQVVTVNNAGQLEFSNASTAGSTWNGFLVKNQNYTLLSTDLNKYVLADSTTATITLIIPQANSVAAGVSVNIQKSVAANTVKVALNNNDSYAPATGNEISLTAQGESIELVSNGVDKWYIKHHSTLPTITASFNSYSAYYKAVNGGTYNFTIPAEVTTIKVSVWGGGGGGSSTVSPPSNLNCGHLGYAGHGGGFSSKTLTVVPGTVYTLTVGNGGTAGIHGNFAFRAGNSGGNSTFGVGAPEEFQVKATGGGGGNSLCIGDAGSSMCCSPDIMNSAGVGLTNGGDAVNSSGESSGAFGTSGGASGGSKENLPVNLGLGIGGQTGVGFSCTPAQQGKIPGGGGGAGLYSSQSCSYSLGGATGAILIQFAAYPAINNEF